MIQHGRGNILRKQKSNNPNLNSIVYLTRTKAIRNQESGAW